MLKAKLQIATCSVESCGKKLKAKGLCAMHYQRLLRHGDVSKTNHHLNRRCTVVHCDKKAISRGYCKSHYYAWYRYKDPMKVRVPITGCKVEHCTRAHRARGYCAYHYRLLVK